MAEENTKQKEGMTPPETVREAAPKWEKESNQIQNVG